MLRAIIPVGLLLLVLGSVTISAAAGSDAQKSEGSKGITVDDLGRGLKSAAQNVEKEIPKLGSAIGNAVKKITEKDSGKEASSPPAKDKDKDKK